MATARKGKIEESPGYCKAEDLANLFALTGQWINQLTRDGVLKKRDTPAGKRYNVVESTRAYVQYLRDKAAGRGEKGIPESKELEKFEAEVRIKQAKAQIAELEAQELQGIMHRSEDVAALTEDLLYTVRDSLMALPGRLAVDVAGAGSAAEAAEIMKREVYVVMKDLSSYQYDPAKYAERVRERMDWKAEHWGDGDDEYEIWLAEAVARGRITAPGFFDDPLVRAAWCGVRWIGPVQGQIDPLKEANAAVVLVDHGFKTHEQVTREMGGGDWDANVEQLAVENAKLAAAGGARLTNLPSSGAEDNAGDKDEGEVGNT